MGQPGMREQAAGCPSPSRWVSPPLFPVPAPSSYCKVKGKMQPSFTFTGKKGLVSRSFKVEKTKRFLSRKSAVLQRLDL